MSKPRLLDLYCCAGGAGMGYSRAGFEVVGIDIVFQPHYPFPLVEGCAYTLLDSLVNGISVKANDGRRYYLRDFSAIHASPPCQAYSDAHRIRKYDHDALIAITRVHLIEAGLPFVIENVVGAAAEMIGPAMLCGAMFPELNVYRHRLFETNWPLSVPPHPPHLEPQTKMGRPPKPGERIHVVGNFSGVDKARLAMGMPWANRDELREAIPPAFTEFIGRQLMAQTNERTTPQGAA